ncbi:Ppx/GppA phosphatase family protein [Enterovirga rhinocerotis]|uniref:Exopolyphosphatase/guanosine-5'-triphosphate, 3'-diphosphate pyrophosphatase n=1 Tax=Enterovirga rhinocerotis TaxID=1339210 RepID=A0A4R7C8Y3_9HYPH|nr:Ppx/GppA phosphatase family protein [Enterovirga rhinocerotis]TDR94898.1 exopolyphosphatase/guanosine-5'-triphosphate,3'-diphosphate pyrophosphatase [Enterovirga rhinocerotis]
MTSHLKPDPRPIGRVEAARPVAIIDIGSNSVRLVIYDRHSRTPTPLYNEKLLCGLGRGVATTQRLPEDAVRRTLIALARFRTLCDLAGVGWVRVLATAAARDAENGPAFLEEAERACGHPVELLTGEREAALSALGVISGFEQPDGIVGDLGGGSLELVELQKGRPGSGMTLPLGGLVLTDLAGASPKKALKIARDALAPASHVAAMEGRTFYAVGGTWRALAKLQMAEAGYPLRVLHGYVFDLTGGFQKLVERAATLYREDADISGARLPLLIYGAVVLDEIVRLGKPREVVVSAFGVREGLLFEELDPQVRAADALLSAATEFNELRSRAPAHGHDMIAWTDAFMRSLDAQESEEEVRLRHAACLLADIGWRAHPDYRGEQSIALIAQSSFQALGHPGRAYLALAVYFRHEGLSLDRPLPAIGSLADERLLFLARLVAAMFRVAYPISIAMAGVLPRAPLLADPDGRLVLHLPPDLAPLANERLENRFKGLGKLLARETHVEIG